MEQIVGTDGHQGHWYTGEEIVRCRDCKYYHDWTDLNHGYICRRNFHAVSVEPNGFCAWGEPKEVK